MRLHCQAGSLCCCAKGLTGLVIGGLVPVHLVSCARLLRLG